MTALKKPAILIPLGLFLVAFLFRLAGIGWGLPNDLHNQSYHPDETVNYGVAQSLDLSHGKLTPGFYNYGTAYFIAENIVDKMAEAYGGGPAGQDPKSMWQFIGRQILAGRILSALAGAGCVVVIWLILRRITTLFGALFGSAVVAIAPGFLVHSRFETVDVFGTFWIFMSALFALRIVGALPGSMAEGEPSPMARRFWPLPAMFGDSVLAGLFAGFATGTKYTGVLAIVILWIALALARRKDWWMAGLLGSAVAFVGFVLTTPGFLLDSAAFWRDFQFELGHSKTGHGLVFAGTPSGFLFHLGNLAAGVGMLLTVAGVVGLVYACYRKQKWAIALLAFAAIYYIVIGSAEVKFLRYTFPLILPLAAGFGYAMGTARRKAGWGHAWVAAGFLAVAGVDFGGLVGAVRYTQYMTANDPRDEAAIYLRQVGSNGTVGLAKDPWFYTPPLIPDAGVNRDQIPLIYQELAQTNRPKVIRYVPVEGLDGRVDWDVRLLTESKPDYIAISTFEAADEDRLSRLATVPPDAQATVDRYKAFMTELDKSYAPANAFGVPEMPAIHDLMYIRPTVWVWKRK